MSFAEGFVKTAAFAFPKMKAHTVDWHSLDPNKPDEAWSAKIDGAHTVIVAKQGEVPRLFSYRQSKRTGGKIEYTPKLPHISKKSPLNAQFRGETYAIDQHGKIVPPEIITAMLNSNTDNSLKFQQDNNLKTRTALIDVEKINGKHVESKMPFLEKRKLMEQFVAQNPDFTLPAIAYTAKEKEELKQQVEKGHHPQTLEGLMVHQTEGPKQFAKAKIWNEHDVYVRGVFHEEGAKSDRKPMAGGFTYSWTENGPVVGRVGTGFSHEEKVDMMQHPKAYIGRVARVQAQRLSSNKTLIKPSFTHWHIEKNIDPPVEKTATIFAKQSIIVDKSIAVDRDEAKLKAKKFADRLYTSRETKSSFRFRQRPPSHFVKGSFRTKKVTPGVSIIYGQVDEKKDPK